MKNGYKMERNNYRYVGGIYRLLEKIDEGTFGKIFTAINDQTQELVAVKIVNSYLLRLGGC